MKHKLMSLLGLCMRARKLVLGEDMVLSACADYPHHLVFLASDAGANITKKLTDKAATYDITIIRDLSTEELSQAIGKTNRTTALITDKGFVNTFQSYLNS